MRQETFIKRKKFKHTCLCGAKNKIVIRCTKCLKFVCNVCSIDVKCLDCFIKINQRQEVKFYFQDKYMVKT